MTTHTTTPNAMSAVLAQRPQHSAPTWFAALIAAGTRLRRWRTRDDATALIKRADFYETSQPSYAADLRAAAAQAVDGSR